MRRRLLLTIPSFLFLGAVANIAVAWILAATCDTGARASLQRRYEPDVIPQWPVPTPSDWPRPDGSHAERRVGVTKHSAGNYMSMYDANAGIIAKLGAARGIRYEFGLPWRSLCWWERRGDPGQPDLAPSAASNRIALEGSEGRFLPASPIGLGFTLNTLFYAALLYTLTLAPFHIRRALPRRRNLCPTCAYPIGASACTECGAALAPWNGVQAPTMAP